MFTAQLQRIDAGIVGDAVLIPEYFNSALAIRGRGGFTCSVTLSRTGSTVHEVCRPDEPDVINWVDLADLARVSRLYALTAVAYCDTMTVGCSSHRSDLAVRQAD